MAKQVKIYKTQAECFRDVAEVFNAIVKKTGVYICPNVTSLVDGGCVVEFLVHSRFYADLTDQAIMECINSVADAHNMNTYMQVEEFEFPEDWYEPGVVKASYFDKAPATPKNLRNNYKLINSYKFGKIFDASDVYDIWPEEEVA